MSKVSPTQRTLAHFRKHGYRCAISEKRVQMPKAKFPVTQDLFGFIDIVAIDHIAGGVIGVQATSGANVASRRTKIEGLEAAVEWVAAGNKLCVIGWRKIRHGKRALWTPRIEYARRENGNWIWEEQ